jgi:hypothetical protein
MILSERETDSVLACGYFADRQGDEDIYLEMSPV